MPSPLLAAHGLLSTNFVVANKVAAFNALHRIHYACDTTAGAFTATLPANPKPGFSIIFSDYALKFDTLPLTIDPNGRLFRGIADVYQIDTAGVVRQIYYVDDTKGWFIK